ncbi:MHYT domain-containing protein [Nocardia sp. NPDC059236]|uniref:MHYT domain-containing protein n=1 Tax=Nocardia sp. NPDC059236 TaxID=3346783 RepID=UPI0036905AB8
MLHIDQLMFGWSTPIPPYIISVAGSVLGLRCTKHARSSNRSGRWLFAAAIALGGCGTWAMSFIAMLGFGIRGVSIRYDVPTTLFSTAIAILAVWIGLWIVLRRRQKFVLPILGGILAGLGIATMQYVGLRAIRCGAHIDYNSALVAASIALAVITATAVLWFALRVHGHLAAFGASLIIGTAVSVTHYTAMLSMRAHATLLPSSLTGVRSVELLAPLITIVAVVMITLTIVVGLAEVVPADLRDTPTRPDRNRSGSVKSRGAV